MDIPLYQLDAFADAPFSGNPAAVMPLESWLPDALLQQLAEENNLSETAFLTREVPSEAPAAGLDELTYHLRWFTPKAEVDLCGHATLAAAAYLFDDVHPNAERITFFTRSGWLPVSRTRNGLSMDFPGTLPSTVDADPALVAAVGLTPIRAAAATDMILVVDTEEQVRAAEPNLSAFPPAIRRGVILTARSDDETVDFVSRFFAPAVGVDEDPVTGSAHAQLVPFWAAELGRTKLVARQLSSRGGTLQCEVVGDRVLIAGTCRRYLDGVVHLQD